MCRRSIEQSCLCSVVLPDTPVLNAQGEPWSLDPEHWPMLSEEGGPPEQGHVEWCLHPDCLDAVECFGSSLELACHTEQHHRHTVLPTTPSTYIQACLEEGGEPAEGEVMSHYELTQRIERSQRELARRLVPLQRCKRAKPELLGESWAQSQGSGLTLVGVHILS